MARGLPHEENPRRIIPQEDMRRWEDRFLAREIIRRMNHTEEITVEGTEIIYIVQSLVYVDSHSLKRKKN